MCSMWNLLSLYTPVPSYGSHPKNYSNLISTSHHYDGIELANLASPSPPSMVLQNPLPHQWLVSTTPLSPRAPATPPVETGVHHLMTLSTKEVNLQTQCIQYFSTTATANPSTSFTSNTSNMPLHLPMPPIDRVAKGPQFPIRHITNNETTWAALNHSIVDDFTQSPTTMSSL